MCTLYIYLSSVTWYHIRLSRHITFVKSRNGHTYVCGILTVLIIDMYYAKNTCWLRKGLSLLKIPVLLTYTFPGCITIHVHLPDFKKLKNWCKNVTGCTPRIVLSQIVVISSTVLSWYVTHLIDILSTPRKVTRSISGSNKTHIRCSTRMHSMYTRKIRVNIHGKWRIIQNDFTVTIIVVHA